MGCGEGKKVICFCLEPKIVEAIERLAKRYGLKRNEIIEAAVKLLALRSEDPAVIYLILEKKIIA